MICRIKKAKRWFLPAALLLPVAAVVKFYMIPRPGPVQLQGLDHMRSYLSGHAAWQSREEAEKFGQYWSFQEDGIFTAWLDDREADGLTVLFPGVFPFATASASGRWSVGKSELGYDLLLIQLKVDGGGSLPDAQLPLGWVDGKLRILIGNVHYMQLDCFVEEDCGMSV